MADGGGGGLRRRSAGAGPLWPPSAVLDALAEPLQSRHDYLAVLPSASADLGGFVRSYTERLLDTPSTCAAIRPASCPMVQ